MVTNGGLLPNGWISRQLVSYPYLRLDGFYGVTKLKVSISQVSVRVE